MEIFQSDAALWGDISDSLSERDKVKFTVHTKSSLPNFNKMSFLLLESMRNLLYLIIPSLQMKTMQSALNQIQHCQDLIVMLHEELQKLEKEKGL